MDARIDRVDPELQRAHAALLSSLPMPAAPASHQFDDDCVCTRCGFDGAEWHHWKHFTYEGKASDAKSPPCTGGVS